MTQWMASCYCHRMIFVPFIQQTAGREKSAHFIRLALFISSYAGLPMCLPFILSQCLNFLTFLLDLLLGLPFLWKWVIVSAFYLCHVCFVQITQNRTCLSRLFLNFRSISHRLTIGFRFRGLRSDGWPPRSTKISYLQRKRLAIERSRSWRICGWASVKIPNLKLFSLIRSRQKDTKFLAQTYFLKI